MQFVLGAVGTAIGGPIGGFIGSAIGSLLDNQLFPVKVEGPRLEDLSVTASTYGKAIPLIYGPENRMAGNVIWSSGLKEKKVKRKVSGKGGPATKVTEYQYSADLAVLLGEGEISGISKIWANNKLIWDRADPLLGGSPTLDPFTGALLSAFGVHVLPWSAMRVYPGNYTQLPDPTIQAALGADTPAYRGFAYVVFADLQLADYGNRIPNIEILVAGQKKSTAGYVVGDVLNRCGLSLNHVSTLALSDNLRGYAIGRETTGTGALKPLTQAFNFDMAEVGGSFRAQSRKASIAGSIPLSDIGAVAGSSSAKDNYKWQREPVVTMAKESTVTYADADRDYQPNAQTDRRSDGSSQNNLSLELSMTLDANKGQEIASRLLWESWVAGQTFDTSLSDRWLALETGRSYLVQTPAGFEPLRLVRSTRGANGVIETTFVRDRADIYSSPVDGSKNPTPPNNVRIMGLSELVLLDLPLLLETDYSKESGFYLGVSASSADWRGAEVMRSSSEAGLYEPIAEFGYDLVTGEVELPTPAPAAGYDSATEFDDVTVIRVALAREDMSLTSLPDSDLITGANAIYLGPRSGQGGEIIQFGIATFVSPGVYDLSRLKRGQRGTEYAWTHPADSFFVLLEQAALKRVDFGYGDVGRSAWYKAVSLLNDESAAEAYQWSNTGSGLRPYSPVDLVAEGETGGDINLAWVRRSRIGHGIIPPPLGEEFERYKVEIRNSAGTATVRSVEVSNATTFIYTVAMQTADFGGPVSSLRWRVAQISAAYGFGTFANWQGAI